MHCNTPNTVMLASFKQLVMLIRSASSRRRASSRPTGPRWRRLRLPVCLCGHCGSDEPRRGGGGEGGSVKLPRAPRQTYTCRSVQRPAQPGPTRVFKKNLLALELFHKRTGVRHDWTECWLGSLRGNYTGHESPIKSNDT